MNQRRITGLLAAALLLGSLPMTARADRGGLTIAPGPENVTIAPKPDSVTVAANAVTRSAVVDRLWALSGSPVVDGLVTFHDTAADNEAVRWAVSEQVTSGYTDTWFGGGDAVTREQLAAMVYRFAQRYDLGFRGAWMFYLGAEDLDQVKEWAMEPMYWMVASRFYDGEAELLRPRDAVTPEEAEAVFTGLARLAKDRGVDFTAPPAAAE